MTMIGIGVPLTKQEEDTLFGLPKYSKGTAFKSHDSTHYYLQRDNDVLHLNVNEFCLNTMHVGALNKVEDKITISVQEFTMNVKRMIYEEDLNSYWGTV